MVNDDNEYRAGALACQEALLSLRPILAGDSSETTAQYFEKRDAALAMILAAAGPMPARAAGAMACIAEMIISCEQDASWCAIGDISQFEAAMSKEEKEQSRLDFAAACDAEML